MKILFLSFALLYIGVCCGQVPLSSDEYTKKQVGFLCYWNDELLTFVLLKNQKSKLSYSQFKTDNLNVGLGLSLEGLDFSLKDMEKHGKKYHINLPVVGDEILTLIPISLTYKVHQYALREDQLKATTDTVNYKFCKKEVKIISVNSIPILVLSAKPITNIH